MRGRSSRLGDGSNTVPIAALDGSLRNLYETVGLDVTLSITREKITVTSDDGELGTWPIGAVGIQPFDSTSYEFHAEGDLLLFTPNDPAAFRTSPFVVGLPPETKHRKRLRVRRKRDRSEPDDVEAPAKSRRRVDPARREHADPATEQTSGGPPDEPSRPEDTDEATHATPEPDDGRDATAVDPEPCTAEAVDVEAEIEPIAAPDDLPGPSTTDPARGREPASRVPARIGIPRRLWIGVLDKARHYDVFDLDRVPTDKRLRGFEHQHTWDHRVARPDGVGSHVCTICGKIRISKHPVRRSS